MYKYLICQWNRTNRELLPTSGIRPWLFACHNSWHAAYPSPVCPLLFPPAICVIHLSNSASVNECLECPIDYSHYHAVREYGGENPNLICHVKMRSCCWSHLALHTLYYHCAPWPEFLKRTTVIACSSKFFIYFSVIFWNSERGFSRRRSLANKMLNDYKSAGFCYCCLVYKHWDSYLLLPLFIRWEASCELYMLRPVIIFMPRPETMPPYICLETAALFWVNTLLSTAHYCWWNVGACVETEPETALEPAWRLGQDQRDYQREDCCIVWGVKL